MFADYHVHTEFSDDSVYPMEQVVQDAIAMKILLKKWSQSFLKY